ncbi:hypothetical protein [Allorhodopirellula solitaria]|uniref:Apea-like HEPN domain-containing protein n=1 Tax=Allorhodopirellula solitaria TaxID=2527987 RepID=A0A5C5WP49_9BACT|nr:hypothetical protein [Allorhodopirellula solitaria]TWT52015.1 hypothetical protein CA85_51250 [Allorhodopirellula solitaria]
MASTESVVGDGWDFGYLMPQISFTESIENQSLALVPFSDPRFVAIANSCDATNALKSGLTDAFGRDCKSSALLVNSNAPGNIDFVAVLDFRNAVAISSLIDGFSLQLSGGNAGYPQWSNYFDFYSYTPTTDGNLVGQSLALTGYERSEGFAGQTTPYLPPSTSIHPGVDNGVLDALLLQWNRKHLNKKSDRGTRALFRSLQVASAASRLPGVGTRVPTIHDLGLSVATWVSAFEVLSHPGNGNANKTTVLDCLEDASWMSPKLKARSYQSKSHSGKTVRRINFCQRLYTELYQTRNDFLHGNKVAFKSLFPFRDDRLPSLPAIAVLVYRAALEGFLRHLPGSLSSNTPNNLEAWFENSFRRRPYEEALENLIARKTT